MNSGNWQKAIWRILSDPSVEVFATILIVMVATCFLIDSDAARQGSWFLFGRR